MQETIPIPSTIAVVKQCWNNAENELRTSVDKKHPDLDEEFIIRLFYDEFAFLLSEASEKGQIRDAFTSDLHAAFPELDCCAELDSISDGLIANLSLHKREVERFTGGDLGLTIIRPQLARSYYDSSEIQIGERQQGLLCQAKIKRRSGRWGTITKKQRDLFPDRMKYLGLLLYSYADLKRRQLNPFSWQLCNGAELMEQN